MSRGKKSPKIHRHSRHRKPCIILLLIVCAFESLSLLPSRLSPIPPILRFPPWSRPSKVNGQLSQTCYLRALDSCYDRLAKKKKPQAVTGDAAAAAAASATGDDATAAGAASEYSPFVLRDVEHVLCHSPYNKLVQKSFLRMFFADARRVKGAGRCLEEGLEEAVGRWLDAPAEVLGLYTAVN